MPILSKGQTFADGDQVTSTKLNNLVDAATFVSGSSGTTDNATLQVNGSGRLEVKTIQTGNIANGAVTTVKIPDSNITTAKIADSNVTTAKIADSNVTTAKIADANVTASKLSGAQTGSAPVYGVRAWVSFDGTKDTTGALSTANTNRLILASGNVTSVQRGGLGNYTVNFTTQMPSSDYVVNCTCEFLNGNADSVAGYVIQSASSVIINSGSGHRPNVNFGSALDAKISVSIIA
jgi:hypothetical protein